MKGLRIAMRDSILAGGLVALAVAGLLACANPADDVPEATVADPAPAAPAAAAEAADGESRTFQLADGSTVSFIGSKITGSHDGGFHGFTGEITLVDGDPTRSSVDLIIDTTTLWADNEKLTGHLKSADFFDVETFPQATFKSTEIVPGDTGYVVTGNLDLHGVTRSITFPATIEVGPDQVKATAEFSVKRFDFDIVYPGKPDDLIRDEVVVKFDVVAAPAADQDA